MEIKFCSQCGASTNWQRPEKDFFYRYVCNTCHFIHYQNPKIVAGCIVYKNNEVLLCKRAIEPRSGLWTLPAGFMENGETTRQAAERETYEETGAQIIAQKLFAIVSSSQSDQVHLFYLAELKKSTFHQTDESSEVKLFTKHQLSTTPLAFSTLKLILDLFFDEQDHNNTSVHEITLHKR